jgi:hypothetical protein
MRRFIEKTSPVKKIRTFSSVKSNRALFCESKLEYHACLFMEFNQDVQYFEAQPESFIYHKSYRYTPDLLVVMNTGESLYVEIKPSYKLQSETLAAKHSLIEQFFSEQGESFIVLTEKDIYSGSNIQNYSSLFRYLTTPIDKECLSAFKETFPTGKAQWGDLRSCLSLAGFHNYFAYQLLALQLLTFDVTQNVTDSMEVSW